MAYEFPDDGWVRLRADEKGERADEYPIVQAARMYIDSSRAAENIGDVKRMRANAEGLLGLELDGGGGNLMAVREALLRIALEEAKLGHRSAAMRIRGYVDGQPLDETCRKVRAELDQKLGPGDSGDHAGAPWAVERREPPTRCY